MKTEYALVVEHLAKTYGNPLMINAIPSKQEKKKGKNAVVAVDDISFKVKKGSLFAFLGINGAGKSTTINIICSILSKDKGKIYVDGKDLDKDSFDIKNEIGIVFQTSVLDQELTVKENLDIRTSFYRLSKNEKKENIDMIVKLLNLEPILNQPIKSLSGGQKRRVDIARAMVHKPKLLILDEPTTGLDPKTRLTVWTLIDKIQKETGMTVFLTTHYLEEADKASYVIIMDKGKIIAEGTPNELKNLYSSDYILSYMDLNEEFEFLLKKDHVSFIYDDEKKAYKVNVGQTKKAKDFVKKYTTYMNDIEILKGNMDDVFLNVTGKNLTLEVENEKKD